MTKESKQDVFAEDDDFSFGGDDKKDAGKADQSDAGKGADSSDDDEGKGQEGDASKDDSKSDGDSKDDDSGKTESKTDDDEDGAEGKKDEEGKSDDDIFSADSKSKDEKKLSLKKLASGFDIELENDDEEEFNTKVKEKIEKSRQEFNLDDYPEDAKKVINHLKENGGKLDDFLNNKNIAALQGVVGLPAEDKVRQVRINELRGAGLTAEKAREQAEKEIEDLSQRELKNMADKIDEDAHRLISEEINKVVGDRKAIVEKEKQKSLERVKEEIKTITKHVESQKEFMGIPLTDKAKQAILKDIETGAFDDIANKAPAASKFAAYMFAKFGDKINDHLKKTGSAQNRKGYNAATDKHLAALHQTKESAKQQGSGHQKANSGPKTKFDGFSGAFDESE